MGESTLVKSSIITARTPKDVVIGEVNNSVKFGAFVVTRYLSSTEVFIRFVATGFERSVSISQVRSGNISDKLSPSIYGVGFMGDGPYKTKVKGEHTKAYRSWFGMMRRCYSEKHQKTNPTYIGVTVCGEWHNFQEFAAWHDSNNIDDYQLDKDVKQRGVDGKVYSPSTCLFISRKENIIEAKARRFRFKNPVGELVELYNLTQFCKENDLHQGHMSAIHSGGTSSYKGWTKY